MANLNFAAQVDAFIAKSKKRATAVFRESTERVIEEMQRPVGAGGNMPVDTGFLRASLQASTTAMPALTRDNPGAAAPYDGAEVSLVIAGADLGETIYAGYTAKYAGHVNYGARGRQPRQFVGRAAQKWPAIVDQVAAEVRAKVK